LQPDPAPSAQPKPSGSSTSTSTQTSFRAAVAPTPQSVAPPPPATVRPAATAPARKQQTRRIASTPKRARKSSTVHRFMHLPGLILDRTSVRAISGQATAASTSRESRLLLAGGLALVLLVIGETTFLALAGARLGFRPERLSRRRKTA
jgi:cytoskeletal protein RodZ